MRVLFLTYFYPPDLCAGAFRSEALLSAFGRCAKINSLEVDVLTTQPHRYSTYSSDSAGSESFGFGVIKRFPNVHSSKGRAGDVRNFLKYASNVRHAVKKKKWDLVFATSSRLMTAALGAQCAKKLKAPLYLDIRDVFSDGWRDFVGAGPLSFTAWPMRWYEDSVFKAAKKINVVSPGFCQLLEKRGHAKPLSVFTNGIDDTFLQNNFKKTQQSSAFRIIYAGNIGQGQSLQAILPSVAKKLGSAFEFIIIGDGAEKHGLSNQVQKEHVDNISFLKPVKREQLIEIYKQADALFLHLNKSPIHEAVLPSKIFEYAATQKPIIAGVTGVAKNFLARNVKGVTIFDPCETQQCVEAVLACQRNQREFSREQFCEQFSREKIMDEMVQDILNIV